MGPILRRRLFIFGKPDPATAPIREWIEIEGRDRRRGVLRWLARAAYGIGIGAVVTVLTALLLVGLYWPGPPAMYLFGIPFTLGAAAGIFIGIPLARRVPSPDLLPSPVRDALDQVELHLGWFGLKRQIGESAIQALSDGASQYLRCREALTGGAWSNADAGPWAEAREDVLKEVRCAMARLASALMNHRSFDEVTGLLDELRLAATESERAARARSENATGAGRGLQASLSRLRELTAAEEELLRLRG
ncbi:MAG TPA: hypothetical protein VKT78_16035 [Fimbriimonadaceae bacterium]|nr:hypothetical protein [Fimbriimonadaceae bacterium]